MRVSKKRDSVEIWLTGDETRNWATKDGAVWLGSTLAGREVYAEFNADGLLDFAIDSKLCDDFDAHEFDCCIADYLAIVLHEDHPAYQVAVGQFKTD